MRNPHGHYLAYVTDGCRCDECREAWATNRREYRKAHPQPSRPGFYLRECVCCGAEWRTNRKDARFCSFLCRDYTTFGPLSRPLPTIRTATDPPVYEPVAKTAMTCEWCGDAFASHQSTAKYCSNRCLRRVHKMARRGREKGAAGTYTWTEVMRLFLLFDRRCAYCETVIDGQPDPDHVIPLSRGGSNSIANILPACRLCNSSKSNHLLDDWAAIRQLRGLPAVTTTWSVNDKRVAHLTSLARAKSAA